MGLFSRLGKKHIKTVYGLPAYLIYMQTGGGSLVH